MTARRPAPTPTSVARLAARIEDLHRDAQACAAAAGLVYVSADEPGISRRRHGRGFSFRDAENRPLTNGALKARILSLAIPPAWTNVWICPDDSGHIMAVGLDDRGRKQYIYHERWRALRDALNFYRLINFGEHLPTVRDHVAHQLRRRTLDRDRVIAAMIRVIDASAVRIGNELYAEENDSFGLSTLAPRHASVTGDVVRLQFPAKSGKKADLHIADRGVARVITELERHRRRRLFTVDGSEIDSAEVNAVLETLTDDHVTAKDFRTWKATHAVFGFLEQQLDAEPADRERIAVRAIDVAAEVLGNTRAVARAHYVHPRVVSAFVDGSLRDQVRSGRSRRPGLDAGERRLLGFLTVALESELDLAALAAPVGPAGRRPHSTVKT